MTEREKHFRDCLVLLVGVFVVVAVALIIQQVADQAREQCPDGVWVQTPTGYACVDGERQ